MGTPLPSPKQGRAPTIFGPCLLWPNGWMDQWHLARRRPTCKLMRLCVRWGPSPSPILGPFLLRANGWMHQDATWYGGRSQPWGLCVRWGPSSLPKKGRSPQFSAMSVASKWLHGSRCHLVRRWALVQATDEDPALLPKKGSGAPSPIFGPCLLWPNGWMNQDGTWHGGGPWSRPHCTR